jgi:hypothetical protein
MVLVVDGDLRTESSNEGMDLPGECVERGENCTSAYNEINKEETR